MSTDYNSFVYVISTDIISYFSNFIIPWLFLYYINWYIIIFIQYQLIFSFIFDSTQTFD